jgi:hypothetical protein
MKMLYNFVLVNKGRIGYACVPSATDVPKAFYSRKELLTEYGFFFPATNFAFEPIEFLKTGKYLNVNTRRLKPSEVEFTGAILDKDMVLHSIYISKTGMRLEKTYLTEDTQCIISDGYYNVKLMGFGLYLNHDVATIINIARKCSIRIHPPSNVDVITFEEIKELMKGKEFAPMPIFSPSTKHFKPDK